MSWRIVVVHNTAKLDLQLQYLVVRSEMKTQKIHISEIALLLVESTSVSLTVGLLAELTRQKVKVIFCDHKRNPSSELIRIMVHMTQAIKSVHKLHGHSR